jgi:hypothetical protein
MRRTRAGPIRMWRFGGWMLLIAASCASIAQENPLGFELSCADSYELDTRVGRLTNNVWNKQAIGDAPYRQCLKARGRGSGREWGWSWSWPVESRTVLAFPQVTFGWKPWNGGMPTDDRLPIAIATIKSLNLTYEIETRAEGKYILSIALWLTRTGRTASAANPSDISADINIWMVGDAFDPAGAHVGDIAVDDLEFEVWYAADMGDASGANANRWNHVVYRAVSPQLSESLDIDEFVADAVSRGYVSREHYVSSIEIGNEVMSGSGATWINDLSLKVW